MVPKRLSVTPDGSEIGSGKIQRFEPLLAGIADKCAEQMIGFGDFINARCNITQQMAKAALEGLRERHGGAGGQLDVGRVRAGVNTEQSQVETVNAGAADGAEIVTPGQRLVASSRPLPDLCEARSASRSALWELNASRSGAGTGAASGSGTVRGFRWTPLTRNS